MIRVDWDKLEKSEIDIATFQTSDIADHIENFHSIANDIRFGHPINEDDLESLHKLGQSLCDYTLNEYIEHDSREMLWIASMVAQSLGYVTRRVTPEKPDASALNLLTKNYRVNQLITKRLDEELDKRDPRKILPLYDAHLLTHEIADIHFDMDSAGEEQIQKAVAETNKTHVQLLQVLSPKGQEISKSAHEKAKDLYVQSTRELQARKRHDLIRLSFEIRYRNLLYAHRVGDYRPLITLQAQNNFAVASRAMIDFEKDPLYALITQTFANQTVNQYEALSDHQKGKREMIIAYAEAHRILAQHYFAETKARGKREKAGAARFHAQRTIQLSEQYPKLDIGCESEMHALNQL